MNKVTVVGLGLDENDITISGAEAIAESDYVIVKTKNPGLSDILKKTE